MPIETRRQSVKVIRSRCTCVPSFRSPDEPIDYTTHAPLAPPVPARACTLPFNLSRAVLSVLALPQCLASTTSAASRWYCPHRGPHRTHSFQASQHPVQVEHLPCLVGLRLIDQRLTHQADDQPVALDGAHALLQLAQDLVLVLDVAAFRLPIGERCSSGPWEAAGMLTDRAARAVSTPAARPPLP